MVTLVCSRQHHAAWVVGKDATRVRAVTMLMKLGLFSRPAMSKLPTPPVCGDKESTG